MTPAEITHAREDLHLTQRALAERLGVSANTVNRWETGTVPSPAYLRLVFDGLELRAENERLRADLRASLADKYSVSNVNEQLRAALRGVLAEADRKTDAFDRAHAALERLTRTTTTVPARS